MKKMLLTAIAWLLLINGLFAQAPQGMNYQAILRDNNGAIIANQNVSLRFSVISGSPTGTTVYQELYSIATTPLGLINLVIGQGTTINGTFANINWNSAPHYLKVEFDPQGGSNFTIIETKQLMSVPYALNAGNAANSLAQLTDVDVTNVTNGQVIKWNAAQGKWLPANDSLGTGGGGSGDNWGSQTVQTDNSLNGNGTSGNVLKIAQQGAAVGNVLKWNGTSWVPANDSIGTGGGGGGDNWGSQTVQTDNTLTGNGTSGNTLKLAPQGATNGNVLKWNGTTWQPSTDNDAQTLSINGNTLSISGGNSVTIPTSGGGGGAISDYAVYVESASSGGNSSTTLSDANWVSRQLNNTEIQVGTSISRSGNTITLQPGTYNIAASATWGWSMPYNASFTLGVVDVKTQLRLRNTTASATLLSGDGQRLNQNLNTTLNGFTYQASYTLKMQGTVTISTATSITLDHFIDWTIVQNPATYNSGVPMGAGESEIYSRLIIQKIN